MVDRAAFYDEYEPDSRLRNRDDRKAMAYRCFIMLLGSLEARIFLNRTPLSHFRPEQLSRPFGSAAAMWLALGRDFPMLPSPAHP